MSERKRMKPLTLAGILILVGIGIGGILSYLLPDLSNLGFGSGWNGFGNPKSAGDAKAVKA